MTRRTRLETKMPHRERHVPEIERRLGVYLRLWRHGTAGQCQVWNDIAMLLGPRQGRHALKALERYWAALASTSGRRACLCSAGELTALVVGRTAAGDRATAARLLRHVAPAASVEEILDAAEAVAAAFLEGEAHAHDHASRRRHAAVPPFAQHAHEPADDSAEALVTHDYPNQPFKH